MRVSNHCSIERSDALADDCLDQFGEERIGCARVIAEPRLESMGMHESSDRKRAVRKLHGRQQRFRSSHVLTVVVRVACGQGLEAPEGDVGDGHRDALE